MTWGLIVDFLNGLRIVLEKVGFSQFLKLKNEKIVYKFHKSFTCFVRNSLYVDFNTQKNNDLKIFSKKFNLNLEKMAFFIFMHKKFNSEPKLYFHL